MGKFFFQAGLWVTRTVGGFFKGVPASQAAGILGTGMTLQGAWDWISGLFSDTANEGSTDNENDLTVFEQLQEALKQAGTAVAVAGFLFVVLVVVVGMKYIKK